MMQQTSARGGSSYRDHKFSINYPNKDGANQSSMNILTKGSVPSVEDLFVDFSQTSKMKEVSMSKMKRAYMNKSPPAVLKRSR